MNWIKETLIKCIKTMAQAAIGVIGGSLTFSEVNWTLVASTVILAGISCILFNIANLEVGSKEKNVPSIDKNEEDSYGL